jgi:putative FmdB family regulatory protein
MPTYEYRCPRGHEFEVFQRISDEPGATCPECGESAERMISAGAGFLFRGEGFYITDYRSKEYKEKSSAEKAKASPSKETKETKGKAAASKDAPKGSGKADSKSASKSEGS